MTKHVKYIVSLLFLALIALPALLSAITMIRESLIRRDMKEALEEKQLLTIFIDIKDIIWEEAGKECRINGRLFDIKEIKKVNNQFQLKGLFDDEEMEIEEQLKNINSHQNKEQRNTIAKFLQLHYLNWKETDTTLKHFVFIKFKFPIHLESIYRIPHLSVFTPPPEIA